MPIEVINPNSSTCIRPLYLEGYTLRRQNRCMRLSKGEVPTNYCQQTSETARIFNSIFLEVIVCRRLPLRFFLRTAIILYQIFVQLDKWSSIE